MPGRGGEYRMGEEERRGELGKKHWVEEEKGGWTLTRCTLDFQNPWVYVVPWRSSNPGPVDPQ